MSSLAPSCDRIEITYGKFDNIIISPKDKVAFTRDLVLVNQNIKVMSLKINHLVIYSNSKYEL